MNKLFVVGTCGMIGSDDVLACFIAGNVFTIEYCYLSKKKFLPQAKKNLQLTPDLAIGSVSRL